MELSPYIKKKYVIATEQTYTAWIKKTRKSRTEFQHVGRLDQLRGLDVLTTEVWFVGNYWKTHYIREKLAICKERGYKIVHIDSF